MEKLTVMEKPVLASPLLASCSFLLHGFSTRSWGNMGLHVGDDPEAVLRNRRDFLEGLSSSLEASVWVRQVHGTRILRASKEHQGSGAFSYNDELEACDGMITDEPGVMLMAVFADCTPIFLADPVTGSAGILHAGWKGTVRDIAGAGVLAMKEAFGSRPEDLLAVIGPRIGAACYEVGSEVLRELEDRGLAAVGTGADGHLDMGAVNKALLERQGVSKIEVSPLCTFCEETLFFSHRRDKGVTGRMAGAIGIRKEHGKRRKQV